MKKTIATILLLCLLATGLIVLSACNEAETKPNEAEEYHAAYYDDVCGAMKKEFLYANKVKAYYCNPLYIEGVTEWTDRYIYAENAPTARTFIVTDESEFSLMFSSFPTDVDFANQMVVIHMFTVINARAHYFERLTVDGEVLRVEISEERVPPDFADTTMPGCKCVAVLMDKAEITSAEFVID